MNPATTLILAGFAYVSLTKSHPIYHWGVPWELEFDGCKYIAIERSRERKKMRRRTIRQQILLGKMQIPAAKVVCMQFHAVRMSHRARLYKNRC